MVYTIDNETNDAYFLVGNELVHECHLNYLMDIEEEKNRYV